MYKISEKEIEKQKRELKAKLKKALLPYGSGQVILLKGRTKMPYQARKSAWDNFAQKNKLIYCVNYATPDEAIEALRARIGKTEDRLKLETETFSSLYNEWRKMKSGMLRLAENSQKQLQSVYNAHCKPLYNFKFASITAFDLQRV
jgi:hypothetical protein